MARARGLAPWQPRAKSLALLEQVNAVLDEYREHLPLTIRQIFYRLVGAHGYSKTETAYDRLGEMLNRARRAGFVRFDAIRDDGVDMRADSVERCRTPGRGHPRHHHQLSARSAARPASALAVRGRGGRHAAAD